MVFRKPYGFLVKHFKFIHLILVGLYIYLAIKVNQIFNFYNNFALGNASKLEAISHVTNYYIIAIVLSIMICLIVYALMRYKKKPRLLYLILIALYLVVAFMIQTSYHGLHTIYISVLDTKTVRLYRDILQIMIWVQYVSIIVVLIRGLGFDIKKFNFVKDLEDLNIEVSDEEEVELTFGGTETAQRKIHRGFREFKYYYLENKIFIHIILGILLVVCIGTFTIQNEIIHKKYRENEAFSTEEFTFQVLNSYITVKDYQGHVVGLEDSSFVVIRMSLGANRVKREFNTSNLILKVNHHSYSCSKKYVSYFSDLGTPYLGQIIGGNTSYIFVYSVSNEDLDKKMELVYAEDKTVSLSPVYLDKMQQPKNYQLNERIDFTQSVLRSGYLQISSYELKEAFSYSYTYVVLEKEYTGSLSIQSDKNVILHLLMELTYPNQLTNYMFLSQYAKLKYKRDDQEYVSIHFNDQTPGDYKDGIYVAVDPEVLNASQIWIEINIRGKQYIYHLK